MLTLLSTTGSSYTSSALSYADVLGQIVKDSQYDSVVDSIKGGWYQSLANAYTVAWSNWVQKIWCHIPIYWYKICSYNYNQALINGTLAQIDEWTTKLAEAKVAYDATVENIKNDQNDIFWSADVASSKLYMDTLVAKINGTTPYLPTFDYYYDAATQTYVVIVSSFR